MKPKDLNNAIQHNKNTLKELGIVLTCAQKGLFSVTLNKKRVKRKNLLTGIPEEKEIYFISSACGKVNFPADLLVLSNDKVSTKLEIEQVECNQKGYISKVFGFFQ
jgi:hypothetical protein